MKQRYKKFTNRESRLIVDSFKKYFNRDPDRNTHFDYNLKTRERVVDSKDVNNTFTSVSSYAEEIGDIKKDEAFLTADFVASVQEPGSYGTVLKFKYIKELADYALSEKFFNENECHLFPFSSFLSETHVNSWNSFARVITDKQLEYILDNILRVEPFARKNNRLEFYGEVSRLFGSMKWLIYDRKKFKIFQDFFNALPLPKVLRIGLFINNSFVFDAKEGFDNSIQIAFQERWLVDTTFERSLGGMYNPNDSGKYVYIDIENYLKAYPNDFDIEGDNPGDISEKISSYVCYIDDADIEVALGILGITPKPAANVPHTRFFDNWTSIYKGAAKEESDG